MAALTPMMQQYRALREQHPTAILLFRLGDFFEAFFDDAGVVARELNLTLTSRPVAKGERIPMCGIPHHALAVYLKRLIDRGHRVAICDQVEDPRAARARGGRDPLVRREVVRVVTPGTLVEDDLLAARENNFLAAVAGRGEVWGAAFADLSTGEFFAADGEAAAGLTAALRLWEPREILVPDGAGFVMEGALATTYDAQRFEPDAAAQALREHFGVATLEGLGLAGRPAATAAAGALIHYLTATQKSRLPHLRSLRLLPAHGGGMAIDAATERALGLWSGSGGRGGPTLLDVIDRTRTPMGGRLLRRWLQQPLLDIAAIEARLDAVEALAAAGPDREVLRERLAGLGDVERITARLSHEAGTPRDLAALRAALAALPGIAALVPAFGPPLAAAAPALAVAPDLAALLARALVDAPPLSPKDGGLIRPGFDAEVDALREGSRAAREWIAGLEAAERVRTGIRSLKVGYNQVAGYYIEVSKANQHLVPPEYVRRGTLVNAERYITAEMKDRETLILGAQERIAAREYEVFCRLREAVRAQVGMLQEAARAVAQIDALAALAESAVRQHYVRPRLRGDRALRIAGGRHPVVEHALGPGRFVPNDLVLGTDGREIVIVTGPNFGGKSTYIRQAALIVLLAQIGSFVPAEHAEIGLVRRIFTRVGATDDLAAGRSTFLSEMIEVARILTQADRDSLVILDEVGRGTSTYDGMSLAWAVVEDLHDRIGARTLFATHYHELTELAVQLPRCVNAQVLVRDDGRDVVFLHRVADGAAASSYGIHVARLAGVPASVIDRAREVLAGLERAAAAQRGLRRRGPSRSQQLPLPLPSPVEEALLRADLTGMSPLEARTFLARLRAMAEAAGARPAASRAGT
jgi:DNA mismatch repair protein MutS